MAQSAAACCRHQLFGEVLTDRPIWDRGEEGWSQQEGPDRSTQKKQWR